MAKKKRSVGKQNLEPSYSPKPAQRTRRALTALDATAPTPSPSMDPTTQSPTGLAPKG